MSAIPRQLRLVDLRRDQSGSVDGAPVVAIVEPRGATYVPAFNRERLGRQLRAVLDLMSDGRERTLPEIGQHIQGAQTAISARLRDLRRLGYVVEARRLGHGGTWVYRLLGRPS